MRTSSLALALVLAVFGIPGCSEVRPTGPTPTDGTGSLSYVLGPRDIFPAERAQFLAVARLANQRLADVTIQTAWSTSDPGILTVSSNGVGEARAPGTVVVSATYQTGTIATTVVVLPAGTFRLWGFVQAKDGRPFTGGVFATVEVIAGIGTGLKAVAEQDDMGEFPPSYILRGVVGPVTIAASAAGYVTQAIELDVQSHTQRDIVMVPAPASPESTASDDVASNRRRSPSRAARWIRGVLLQRRLHPQDDAGHRDATERELSGFVIDCRISGRCAFHVV